MGSGTSREHIAARSKKHHSESLAAKKKPKAREESNNKDNKSSFRSTRDENSPAHARYDPKNDDAEKIFNEGANGLETISLQGLKRAVAASGIDMREDEIEDTFAKMDTEGNGAVTRQDFVEAWTSSPTVDSEAGVLSLLNDVGVLKELAGAMLKQMAARQGSLPNSIQAVVKAVKEEDLREAWDASKNAVLKAFGTELSRLRSNQQKTVKEFNAKFAQSGAEAVYKDMREYSSGVEGTLGLPGKDIAAGIEMEFCYSEDSHDVFKTTNYDGTETTPAEEYRYVVEAQAGKEYSGKRFGTPLEAFLLASCAKKAGSDTAAFDCDLKDLGADMQDAVKAVLLRRVQEVSLSKTFLATAAEDDARLQRLAASSDLDLRRCKHKLAAVISAASTNPATGQPRFAELAKEVRSSCGLKASELEALIQTTRRQLSRAGLLEEEVLALRLYTGPPYVKLNGTLRERDVGGKGNRYVCTVFAAISGMAKLAEVSPIPEGRVVFRGQHGMRLPKRFWKSDAQGVRGGVELAFLSTTTDVDVAVGYAAAGELPTVFQIQTGAVDKGAALGFLSQYPGEEEILMPPRSFLEVVGAPTVMATKSKGTVLCIPSKINCNLQSPRLERLREARKTMLVSTLHHVRKEVSRDVDAVLATPEAKQRVREDRFWPQQDEFGGDWFVSSIKQEPVQVLEAAEGRPAAWYNEDRNFRLAMAEALDIQRWAMGKLALYVEDRALNIAQLKGISARDCDRKAAGRLRRLLEEEGEEGESNEADRKAAMARLCRHLELFQQTVEEQPLTGYGETALLKHAAEGRSEAVRLLLEAQADVEAVRADGRTALMLAAEGGLTDMVRMLVVEWQAKPDVVDEAEGRSAIMYAAENGHVGTVHVLLREGRANATLLIPRGPYCGCTITLRVAYYGYLRVLQELHREGVLDVHTPNEPGGGWTPLMNAALNGHQEVVEWLVRTGGADVEQAKVDGGTALTSAASGGFEGIVHWLVEHGGADPGVRRKDGMSAADVAAEKGHGRLAEWLAERESRA